MICYCVCVFVFVIVFVSSKGGSGAEERLRQALGENSRSKEIERYSTRTGGVSSASSDSPSRLSPLDFHPPYQPQAKSSVLHSDLFGNHFRASVVVDSAAHHNRSLGVVSSVASSSNLNPIDPSRLSNAPYQPRDGIQQIDRAINLLDSDAKNAFSSFVNACCRRDSTLHIQRQRLIYSSRWL